MRALARDEMPSNTVEGWDEISFRVAVIKYGVKLSLALFFRQFLSELPNHQPQVSSTLWEKLLALCVMWHRAYERDPNMADLHACFGLKSPHKTSGTYNSYSFGARTLKKEY